MPIELICNPFLQIIHFRGLHDFISSDWGKQFKTVLPLCYCMGGEKKSEQASMPLKRRILIVKLARILVYPEIQILTCACDCFLPVQ